MSDGNIGKNIICVIPTVGDQERRLLDKQKAVSRSLTTPKCLAGASPDVSAAKERAMVHPYFG